MNTDNYSTMPELTIKYKKSDAVTTQIASSYDTDKILRKMFDSDTLDYNESFITIFLDASNKTIGWHKVSQGGITSTVVDVRQIFSVALKVRATQIILAHNHPSGNLKPSAADGLLTDKIKQAGKVLDIKLLDHLILSDTSFYSFADNGIL